MQTMLDAVSGRIAERDLDDLMSEMVSEITFTEPINVCPATYDSCAAPSGLS